MGPVRLASRPATEEGGTATNENESGTTRDRAVGSDVHPHVERLAVREFEHGHALWPGGQRVGAALSGGATERPHLGVDDDVTGLHLGRGRLKGRGAIGLLESEAGDRNGWLG